MSGVRHRTSDGLRRLQFTSVPRPIGSSGEHDDSAEILFHRRGNMTDGSAEILFQSFLQGAIVSTGTGRDAHSLCCPSSFFLANQREQERRLQHPTKHRTSRGDCSTSQNISRLQTSGAQQTTSDHWTRLDHVTEITALTLLSTLQALGDEWTEQETTGRSTSQENIKRPAVRQLCKPPA